MPKGKGASGSNREAESTDAPVRGGLLRSSNEAGVMLVERRERAIAIWLGSTGNGRNPMFNGRRQPSRGGTSRMTREWQVRFCEGLGASVDRCPRHVGFSTYRFTIVISGLSLSLMRTTRVFDSLSV